MLRLCCAALSVGLGVSVAACAGAPSVQAPAQLADAAYVHPQVSGRLSVRVIDVGPAPGPADPPAFGALDGDGVLSRASSAELDDPRDPREAEVARALGGARRPTLDCFAPGQASADVWIVGRTGNAGHVRALDVASSTAGRDATRCVLSSLWGAVLPGRGIAFSYLLHVEPWPTGCTTVDCESLPDLPPLQPKPASPPDDLSSYSPARYVARLRRCYSASLARDPNLTGSLNLRLRIGGDGTVTNADASSSTFSDAQLTACIVSSLASMTFPPPESGEPFDVVYPIRFVPGATGVSPVSAPPRRHGELDARGIVEAAEANDIHAAIVPGGEVGTAQPFVVFLERGGRVAAVRRLFEEPPPNAVRRTRRIGPSLLVLDDPERAFDASVFDALDF
ncbi:MAG: AgmX/PglI C-terminal domain-containing protein [Polyangiaceae bacterium]